MATALSKEKTIDMANLAVQCQQLKDNTGAAVDMTTLTAIAGTAGTGTFNDISGGDASLDITGQAAAQGGAVVVKGGTSSTAGNTGGAASLTGGTPGATSAGGAANVTGGIGGATSGNGGSANVTGGAATAGNGGGGSVVLTGGAKNGSGIAGGVFTRSIDMFTQGAPAAKTTATTLTGAEVAGRLITCNQGGGAAANYQFPTGTNLLAALPAATASNDSFYFHVVNISTVAAEDITFTTNTDLTLVGSMVVASNAAATDISTAIFLVRYTGGVTFTIYRVG